MATGCKNVKGTDIQVGDVTLGFGKAVSVTQGQHMMGARYADIVFDDGNQARCWAGFFYHVECEVVHETL